MGAASYKGRGMGAKCGFSGLRRRVASFLQIHSKSKRKKEKTPSSELEPYHLQRHSIFRVVPKRPCGALFSLSNARGNPPSLHPGQQWAWPWADLVLLLGGNEEKTFRTSCQRKKQAAEKPTQSLSLHFYGFLSKLSIHHWRIGSTTAKQKACLRREGGVR